MLPKTITGTNLQRTAWFYLAGWFGLAGAVCAEQPPDSVRIAGAMYLGDVPTAVAETFDTFGQQGIEARVDYSQSGQRSLERLRSGEADLALMALTPLVLDRLADTGPGRADDPVILASLAHSSELTQMFVRVDAGIREPSNLTGKRIAVQCGTNTDFALWLFQRFHGLDPEAMSKTCIRFGDTTRALREGRVEAAILPDPWTFEASALAGEVQSVALKEFGLRHIYTGTWVLVSRRHFVTEHPGVARRVVGAYLDAIDIIEARPEKALEAYNSLKERPYRVTREQWESLDYDLSLTWALLSALRQQIRWASAQTGRADHRPLEVLDFIDARPLHALRPELVDIPVAGRDAESP